MRKRSTLAQDFAGEHIFNTANTVRACKSDQPENTLAFRITHVQYQLVQMLVQPPCFEVTHPALLMLATHQDQEALAMSAVE